MGYNLVVVAVQKLVNQKWSEEDPTRFMHLFGGHQMVELQGIMASEYRMVVNGRKVPWFAAFSWAQEVGGCYVLSAMSSPDQQSKPREIVNLQTLQSALKLRTQSLESVQDQMQSILTL